MLGWQLLLLGVLDAEHFWLPRALTMLLIASGLAVAAADPLLHLPDHLVGAIVGYLLLAGLAWAYRRLRGRDGLGGGDAWLLAGGGAWTGWQSLPSILVLAAVTGLLHVMLLWLCGRLRDGREPIPFGIGLAVGIWLTWLYGPLDRALTLYRL
jgi:leader peptidase (prepilin peptidase) / N-methyltransferase